MANHIAKEREDSHGSGTLESGRDILSIRDEMNRFIDELFGRTASEEGTWVSGAWMPPKDGMLEVRLPKAEAAKPKRIAIAG